MCPYTSTPIGLPQDAATYVTLFQAVIEANSRVAYVTVIEANSRVAYVTE